MVTILASVLGALIAGGLTLLGVHMTISGTFKRQKEQDDLKYAKRCNAFRIWLYLNFGAQANQLVSSLEALNSAALAKPEEVDELLSGIDLPEAHKSSIPENMIEEYGDLSEDEKFLIYWYFAYLFRAQRFFDEIAWRAHLHENLTYAQIFSRLKEDLVSCFDILYLAVRSMELNSEVEVWVAGGRSRMQAIKDTRGIELLREARVELFPDFDPFDINKVGDQIVEHEEGEKRLLKGNVMVVKRNFWKSQKPKEEVQPDERIQFLTLDRKEQVRILQGQMLKAERDQRKALPRLGV